MKISKKKKSLKFDFISIFRLFCRIVYPWSIWFSENIFMWTSNFKNCFISKFSIKERLSWRRHGIVLIYMKTWLKICLGCERLVTISSNCLGHFFFHIFFSIIFRAIHHNCTLNQNDELASAKVFSPSKIDWNENIDFFIVCMENENTQQVQQNWIAVQKSDVKFCNANICNV